MKINLDAKWERLQVLCRQPYRSKDAEKYIKKWLTPCKLAGLAPWTYQPVKKAKAVVKRTGLWPWPPATAERFSEWSLSHQGTVADYILEGVTEYPRCVPVPLPSDGANGGLSEGTNPEPALSHGDPAPMLR
jgi:hypothetical protein